MSRVFQHGTESGSADITDLKCNINEEYSVDCKLGSDNEVYIPFSFIKEYFEVSRYVY